jgi:hypothetical protein
MALGWCRWLVPIDAAQFSGGWLFPGPNRRLGRRLWRSSDGGLALGALNDPRWNPLARLERAASVTGGFHFV